MSHELQGKGEGEGKHLLFQLHHHQSQHTVEGHLLAAVWSTDNNL
jgi:hypothetical protein